MKPELLEWLRCPACASELRLTPFQAAAAGADEVEEGLLACPACSQAYPVTGGIPRMLPNALRRHPAYARQFAAQIEAAALRRPPRETVRRFEKLHRLTARAFGYEWNTYQTTSRNEDVLTFYWLTGADAGLYARLPVTDVFSYYPTDAEVAAIDPAVLRGASVLEVGCGMGKYLKVASDHARTVIGLDLSDAVLRAHRETRDRPNVHVVQGDILTAPLRAASVDFVYSVGVLHHTPDCHAAFLRSASLVKPGGRLAVWLYPEDPTPGRYARWAHYLQDEVLRPVTCRLPPRALRAFAAALGRLTFVRDRYAEQYRATGSRLAYRVAMAAGAVAVGRHRDPEIAAFLNFDWYSPQYRSYHNEHQLKSWYAEAGFEPPTILPQRVSGIARRPSPGGATEERMSTAGAATTAPGSALHSARSIFDQCGPWQSQFVVEGQTLGGPYNFPADPRIRRLSAELSLQDKRVLELGCLEGGHSLALSALGPRELVAVEGRPANYVRCCVIKNLFALDTVRFRLDDVRQVTPERYGTFDVVVAMGVLYHLPDPHALLANLPRLADTVYLSTHYANDKHPQHSPEAHLETPWGRFRGKRYNEYGLADPLSGLEEHSFWLRQDDLLEMCRRAGFSTVKIVAQDDDPKDTSSWIELLLKR
jgi:SAM-dependent methyltransferase/uncharacterized protein YbaR (Trm112 family)